MLDFPAVPKGHKHERIHRRMFWFNSIDPVPESVKEKMIAQSGADVE